MSEVIFVSPTLCPATRERENVISRESHHQREKEKKEIRETSKALWKNLLLERNPSA
jgi:uncharacterized Zn finger protein (UPF0148 family)